MKRFHIIVANHKKISSFVNNFQKIQGFNPALDVIYIFDSSPTTDVQSEWQASDQLCSHGLEWNKNLFFIRRRNWGLNEGTFLDYFRCLLNGKIIKSKYVAFMQDHYLDSKTFVKEDSIPDATKIDLDAVEFQFQTDISVGCVFYTRRGIRVCTTNPLTGTKEQFFGDKDELLPGGIRRCFCVDGGNFVSRPEPYMDFFNSNPEYLTSGDGSYGFTHVWEVRKGQILYDRGIRWVDMLRSASYQSIEELDALEKERGKKYSALWYDNRTWYFFYGRDQWKYPVPALRPFLSFIKNNWRPMIFHSRNTHLEFNCS